VRVFRFIWLMLGRSCRKCRRDVFESVSMLVRLCRLFCVFEVLRFVGVGVLVCVFTLFFCY